MSDYKRRVFNEKIDLQCKLGKLRNFILTDDPIFNSLPQIDRELLQEQLEAMEKYLLVLRTRIDLFDD